MIEKTSLVQLITKWQLPWQFKQWVRETEGKNKMCSSCWFLSKKIYSNLAALSLSYLKYSDTFLLKYLLNITKSLSISAALEKSNFWYREKTGFPLGNGRTQLATQASSGSLVSSSVVLARTQPYLVCLLSVLLLTFASPFISEEHAAFSLAALLSPSEWLPTPTRAFYLFSARIILSSYFDRNSWQERKRLWTTLGYMA